MPSNATVDTRIVEAKFDSKDFEKGVDKTIKKLDELKKSMNVKETGESIADLGKQATKTMDQASKSIDNLNDRLTTFSGMLKQKLLGGIADQVVGAIFKIQNAVNGFVRSISSDQISVGMQKYTEMLNAVRVMVNSGIKESNAYEAMEELRNYSDQTSYSLTQMSDAMSKFIAAGSGLENAKKMAEGVANAAASMGVSITDASRAYYNLQQAYTQGKMLYQDWRSFEMLNMASADFKKNILDAAAEAGTLVKNIDKAGKETYKINKGKGKGKQVDLSSFSETLRYEWLNREVMDKVFGGMYYLDFEAYEDSKEELEKADLTDSEIKEKLIEQYGELAVKAYESAKEARSFVDVVNTLKDVVATGWSKSFELIFGRLEQAKEFFTWLSESHFAKAIYNIGEFRNNILEIWSRSDFHGESGATKAFEALKSLDDIVRAFGQSLDKIMPNAETLGWKLRNMTFAFAENIEKLHTWLTEVDKESGKSRIDQFAKIIANLGTVFSIAGKLIGIAGDTFMKVLKRISPILDAVGAALERATEPLTEVSDSGVFDKITQGVDNVLTIIQPVLDVLPTLIGWLGEIGAFLVSMSIDTIVSNITFISDALGLLLELFGVDSAQKIADGEGILGGISKEIENMKAVCMDAVGAVDTFLKTLISDLRNLFGLGGEESGAQEGGIFSGLRNFFDTNEFVQSIKAWVNQAILDIRDFVQSIPDRISQFAINFGDIIHKLFFEQRHMETAEGGMDYEVATPLKQWLDNTVRSIKKFIADIPNKIKSAGSLIGQIWNSLFYDEKELPAKRGNKLLKDGPTRKVLKPWIQSIITFVQDFIKKIPEYINTGISAAGGFLRQIIGAIFGKKDGEPITGEDIAAELAGPFKNISIQSILENIRTIGQNILNQVAGIFTGTEDADINAEWWSNLFANALTWLQEKAAAVWPAVKTFAENIFNEVASWFTGSKITEENKKALGDAVGEAISYIETHAKEIWETAKVFFVNLPTTIANFFTGDSVSAGTSAIETAIKSFAETIGGFILDIPTVVMGFVTNAITALGNIWDQLYASLSGERKQEKDVPDVMNVDWLPKQKTKQIELKEKSKWELFVESLGKAIQKAIETLPTIVAQAVEVAIAGIDEAIQGIGKWFDEHTIADEAVKSIDNQNTIQQEALEKLTEGGDKAAKEAESEQSPLAQSLIRIGKTIAKMVTESIPTAIGGAFEYVKNKWSEWSASLAGIFTELTKEDNLSGVKQGIQGLGEKIQGFIENLPTYIETGWNNVKAFVEGLFGGGQEGSLIPPKAANKIHQQYEQDLGEVADDTKKENNSFFKSLGETFRTLFASLGPKIIDGFAVAIEYLGKGLEEVTNWINNNSDGEGLFDRITKSLSSSENEQQELSPLMKSIFNLGKRLYELLTQIIPAFIIAASGEISTTLQSTLGGLFDMIFPDGNDQKAAEGAEKMVQTVSDTAETLADGTDAEGAKDGIDALKGVLTSIGSFISDFSTSDVAKIGLIVAGIVVVMNTIKSVFENMNVAGNMADYMKWSAIKTAILGLFSIIAYMVALPAIDENAAKRTEEMLETIKGIIETVTTMLAVLATWKSISGIVGLFGGKGEGEGKGGIFSNIIANFIGGGAKTLGAVTAGNLIVDSVNDLMQDAGNTVTQLSGNFETIAGMLDTAYTQLAPLANKIDDVKKVAAATYVIFGDLNRLKLYKSGMNDANAVLITMSKGVEAFKQSVSGKDVHAKEISAALDQILGLKGKMREFAEFSKEEKFEDFKYVIGSLGAALSLFHADSFSNVVTDQNGIEKAVEVLTAIFGSEKLGGLASALSETPFPNSKTTYGQMEGLTIFAGSLMTLANAVTGLDENAGIKITTLFNVLGDISVPSSLDTNKIIDDFSALGLGLSSFADGTKDITSDMVTNARAALDILVDLAHALSGTGQTALQRFVEGDQSITNFASNIVVLGKDLGIFFNAISNITDAQGNAIEIDNNTLIKRIEAAGLIIRSVTTAARTLAGYGNKMGAVSSMSVYFSELGSSVKNFIRSAFGMEANATKLELDDSKVRQIYHVMDYVSTMVDWLGTINGLTDISDKIKQFEDAALGFSKDGEFQHGLLYTIDDILTSFAAIYARFEKGMVEKYGMKVSMGDMETLWRTLSMMFDSMSTLWTGIREVTKTNGYYQPETQSSWKDIIEIMEYFTDQMDTIRAFLTSTASLDQWGLNNAVKFFEGLNQMISALVLMGTDDQGIYDGLINLENFDFGRIAALAERIIGIMYDAFEADTMRLQITDIGADFASVLVEGIQAALNSEDAAMHPKIIPVLDMESLGGIKEQLSDAFASGNWDAPILQINEQLSGLADMIDLKIIDYSGKLDSIQNSINQLPGSIGAEFSNAVSEIDLSIDGDTIGSIIDRKLGQYSFLFKRGNAYGVG